MERTALRCLKWGLLFTCIDIRFNNIELLPNFVGLLLFYASLQAHEHRTQTEERIKPLFLILAADYFLHWIWQFENGVEGVLRAVIYLYAMYVMVGEVAGRIRVRDPERARSMEAIQVGMVLVQLFSVLVSPYQIEVLNFATIFAAIGVWASFVVVLWGVVPEE